jgi:hypothetical protein
MALFSNFDSAWIKRFPFQIYSVALWMLLAQMKSYFKANPQSESHFESLGLQHLILLDWSTQKLKTHCMSLRI